ncbi:MAG: flagellar motor protein MotB [Thiotrichales bacterium]
MCDEMEQEEECPAGLPAWLATFADLMALLMCFFVLLLSFSVMDAEKYKQIAGSMRLAFGVQKQIKAEDVPKGTSLIKQEYSPGKPEPTPIKIIQQKTIDTVKANINTIDPVTETVADVVEMMVNQLEEEIKDGLLELEIDDEAVMIRINEEGSFPSGGAQLSKSFIPVLEKLSKILNTAPGKVVVAGHTDDIPIATRRYPSNWLLSADRAATVVHYLTKHGFKDHRRIQIRAYADSEPLVPNTSRENRAKNRRIEININTQEEDVRDLFKEETAENKEEATDVKNSQSPEENGQPG